MTHKHVPLRDLVLDWDGVMNVENASADTQSRLETAETREGEIVRYDPSVVAALTRIIDTAPIRTFWLSSNGWHVPSRLAPAIGIRGLESSWNAPSEPGGLGYPPPAPHSLRWWKVNAVLRHTLDAQSVLWVDDHITEELSSALRGAGGSDRLSWIAPRSSVGLTRTQVRQIATWAETGGRICVP